MKGAEKPTLEFSLVGLLRHATLNLLESKLVGNIENRLVVSLLTTLVGVFAFSGRVGPSEN
jgi:hypothetical protein